MSDRLAERMQKSMDSLVFSESEKRKIYMQLGIRAAQDERMITMKKTVRYRRIIAIAAVCVMVMGAAVFAAGKITTIFSSGHSGYDYKTAKALTDAAISKDLSKLPAQFSNGFAFEGGNLEDVKGADDNGNTLSTWAEVSAVYKSAGREVTVTESRMPDGMFKESVVQADETRIIDGTEATYRYYDYLFVPPDYEPDEETTAREKEDPHFTISYGTDTITNQHADFVIFEKDGINYNIMSFDGVSQEELFSIAEDLIK